MRSSFFVLAALFAAVQSSSLKQMMLAQVEDGSGDCGCSGTCDVTCDDDCTVYCPPTPSVYCDVDRYELNSTSIGDSDAGGIGDYNGTDGQGTLSGQYNGAQSHQGVYQKAIPDILKKVNKVENGSRESQAKDQEDFSGTRTKTFTICGEITINEHQCGGICKAESTCEANTGEHVCESITRVGDAEAEVEPVASQSGHPQVECIECPCGGYCDNGTCV